ncbi:MAG: ribose 5-phosphate isomerase B [Bacteroidia bacterium]
MHSERNLTGLKIAIGSDHAGFLLKEKLRSYLEKKNILVVDCGCFSEERADYPDFGHRVATEVEEGGCEIGLIMCGSGNGINMAANKHAGIRSALCWNEEIAKLARLHNDANVLALPARFMEEEEAIRCVNTFLTTSFEGGRHADRIKKIAC